MSYCSALERIDLSGFHMERGSAMVLLRGTGEFSGSKVIRFEIVPGPVS